jgi:Ca2+/H+ antiporter
MDDPLVRNLITALAMLLAAVGVVVVRRFVRSEDLRNNNEFTGFTFAFVGSLYAVFLAFTVIVVWQHFQDVDGNATSEAAHLHEVWRDAAALPNGLQIQQQVRTYASSVVEHEWPSMAAGRANDPRTDRIYEELWRRVYAVRIEPGNHVHAALYSESIHQLNDAGMQRRLRLISGKATVPAVMWVLLIAGGIGMIAFTYLIAAKHQLVQLLSTVFLAGMLTYSVLIVVALEDPFSGDVSVGPEAFRNVIQTIDTAR